MEGLRLDALNLTQQSTHHSHLVHNPGPDYHTHINIPEVRGWSRDQFRTLSLGQIDQQGPGSHLVQVIRSRRHLCVTDDVPIDSAVLRIAIHT